MARNPEVDVLSDPSASIMLGDALARGDKTKDATAACDACPIAMSLLSKLREGIERIPTTNPAATTEHRLYEFGGDPSKCIQPGNWELDWEDLLNPMMKRAFGWGDEEVNISAREMLHRGQYGLDGFIKFVDYFVTRRGLMGGLIESKTTAILKALESACVHLESTDKAQAHDLHRYPPRDSPHPLPHPNDPITVDSDSDPEGVVAIPIDTDLDSEVSEVAMPHAVPRRGPRTGMLVKKSVAGSLGKACGGVLVSFPAGKNQHTSYPFGLHQEQVVPWDYRSVDDKFYLQARSCSKQLLKTDEETCRACESIKSTPLYQGIANRIEHGVHENTPLVYHGIGGLLTVVRRKISHIREMRLMKLNTSRKLLGKVALLEDHKQWILAIASGRVDRVAALVQAGLAHRAGIRSLIQQYERAANQLYKPKGYTQEDIMRSIVLLRLGGARVAEFAHRSLSLPSVTTIRRNTVIRPLIISPTSPTVAEVEANILSCSEAFSGKFSSTSQGTSGKMIGNQGSNDESRAVMPSTSGTSFHPEVIYHQVIMLDELAVEKRPRWDSSNDKFQGTCREHNHKISLTFSTEKELDMLCSALDSGEVHLANEVRIPKIVLFLVLTLPRLQ
jgi:hypothetical protein